MSGLIWIQTVDNDGIFERIFKKKLILEKISADDKIACKITQMLTLTMLSPDIKSVGLDKLATDTLFSSTLQQMHTTRVSQK